MSEFQDKNTALGGDGNGGLLGDRGNRLHSRSTAQSSEIFEAVSYWEVTIPFYKTERGTFASTQLRS